MVWATSNASDLETPCFWGNMPFGKSIEIILLARAVGATHIVESGRMGGMSLTHYDHFNFSLSSVEFRPIQHVETSMRSLYPKMRLLNGDGTFVVQSLSEP
jgi:hypothetical protein